MGTATALLGGSTYHSVFGINNRNPASTKALSQVRSRLTGVDYIFFDEVSMLSSQDMFKIHNQLARVLDAEEVSFGGMYMIFAGDFTQLPPISGESWSLYGKLHGYLMASKSGQEHALRKGLWHQVNTVVILQQNMRQKLQTPDDQRLRTALENMRFHDCTEDDITFLKSRVSGRKDSVHTVTSAEFRNVSIITAWNVHKDKVNRLGTLQFANKTKQELMDFFTDDTVKPPWNSTDTEKRNRTTKQLRKIKNIDTWEAVFVQGTACNDTE